MSTTALDHSQQLEPIVFPVADKKAPAARPMQAKELQQAFEQFNEMSQQLATSYQVLETRVADLTSELNHVSEQRLQELAEKERLADRLENLLNVLPGGVVVLDSRGLISDMNPAAIELLDGKFLGTPWRDLVKQRFAPRQDDGHEVSTRDGRKYSIATRSLNADGQIILLTDQTETRRLQSELHRHERLSSMGKMVSALAHQIRTPLSSAMLYASHLGGDQLGPAQQQKFANKLLGRLNHMERQIQDMLLFVKGELPLNDQVSVEAFIQSFKDAMDAPVQMAGAKVNWLTETSNFTLRCNVDALVNALMNLVNNALQACGDKKAVLTVRISEVTQSFVTGSSKKNFQALAVVISDNGPGLPKSIENTAMDLFVTTKPQGTGLGLAVVKAVVNAHGGKFKLSSVSGEGTRALITLPLAEEALDAVNRASRLSL